MSTSKYPMSSSDSDDPKLIVVPNFTHSKPRFLPQPILALATLLQTFMVNTNSITRIASGIKAILDTLKIRNII